MKVGKSGKGVVSFVLYRGGDESSLNSVCELGRSPLHWRKLIQRRRLGLLKKRPVSSRSPHPYHTYRPYLSCI